MPDTPNHSGEDITRLAAEISRYIEQRDGAADTLEGLVTWWLFRQRLEEAEQKVSAAVEYLCGKGVLQKRLLSDGSTLYVAVSSDCNQQNF